MLHTFLSLENRWRTEWATCNFGQLGHLKNYCQKTWESLAVTHIFLLKSHNEKTYICDRPWLLSNCVSYNCLNLWDFLIPKPDFFKLIASREEYGHFSEESNFHGAFQEENKPWKYRKHTFCYHNLKSSNNLDQSSLQIKLSDILWSIL